MSQAYIGEIRPFSFNSIPKGWAVCNGQFLPISSNQALYSLLGTVYGGNGTTTFGLPNLQGRLPLCFSSNYPLGQASGEVNHTLVVSEMPAHNHPVAASGQVASVGTAAGNYPAAAVGGVAAYDVSTNTVLGTGSASAGGSQAHQNMPPYLVLNFCIATTGIYPSRS